MRTIVTGIIVFVLWSALCTWYYVTRIKAESPEGATPVEQAAEEPPPEESAAQTLATEPEPEPVSPGSYTVYHDFDRSTIILDQQFDSYIESAVTYLDQSPDKRISVTGHTDYIGSDDYNYRLGQSRAESTRDYLISKGIPGQMITISSKGESTPIASNETNSGRAQNRRTEIEINE
jgi:outer membrane protein OmpA-like peptidoglycan-associated protein